MKHLLIALSLLSTGIASYAQTDYNKWSVGLAVGTHDLVTPTRAQTRIHQFQHVDANVRYMFNNRFGLMLDGGYDLMDFHDFPRNSNYIRGSVQAVINLGDLLRFETFTKRFGLLAHAGAGGSFLSQKDSLDDFYRKDKMFNAIIGITPQFKVTDRWSVKLDVSGIVHNSQNWTFDFGRKTSARVINGALVNFSIGATYYIGKHVNHADWIPTNPGVTFHEKVAELENRVAELERQMKDDDSDGVPNFRDKDPNTKPGVVVNSLGEEIVVVEIAPDQDKDGFADAIDECPTVPGKLNGCPDTDHDGVPDYRDNCPNEFGLIQHNGCALSKTTLDIIQKASESIFFDTGKDVIKQSSFSELDKIVQIMKENPEVLVKIEGHTDNVGGDAKNLQLSKDRALAVKNYLISKGLATSRVSSEGYGSSKPVADNNTEVGRAQNRRVVITTSTFTETIRVEEGK